MEWMRAVILRRGQRGGIGEISTRKQPESCLIQVTEELDHSEPNVGEGKELVTLTSGIEQDESKTNADIRIYSLMEEGKLTQNLDSETRQLQDNVMSDLDKKEM